MKYTHSIIKVGAFAVLLGVVGCRHTKSSPPPITEPVGVITLKEHPSGKPGVFTTVDPSAEPIAPPKVTTTVKPPLNAIPTALPKMVDDPLLRGSQKPFGTTTPSRTTMIPALPAENITSPSTVTKPSILPLGITPLAPPAPVAEPIKSPKAIVPPPAPVPVQESKKITPEMPNIDVTTPEVDYTKGNLPNAVVSKLAGHAADFSWIIGELQYSNSKKTWRLRYQNLDSDDSFGGSVTLTGADHLMEQFTSGQLVRVQGEVLDHGKTLAPRYRVSSINIVQ